MLLLLLLSLRLFLYWIDSMRSFTDRYVRKEFIESDKAD